jgi:Arc/MetJ-type ribon-helix-helix transcriptional regulator
MIIDLPKNLESSIHAMVDRGRFASVDEAMAEAARLLLLRERPHEPPSEEQPGPAPTPPRKPLWEVFQEIAASIPDHVWESMPADGSKQHDHYIYGTPKRPPA